MNDIASAFTGNCHYGKKEGNPENLAPFPTLMDFLDDSERYGTAC
jgi:hypothetical protein